MEQTDCCQLGGMGEWMKIHEGISQEHICMTCGQRQCCGYGLSEGGARGRGKQAKVGGNEDICNSVNNKNKETK